MKRIICLIALAVALAFACSANAATVSGTMLVQIDVTAGCTMIAPTIGVGSYTGYALVTLPGTVSVTCNTGTPYTVTMDAGLNYAAGSRYLSRGVLPNLGYSILKLDSTEWGDSGYGGTFAMTGVSGTGTGAADNTPLTINVPAVGYAPAPGSYVDTVNVIVNY
ncbi:MAG: spore coat protein U domain-containing protein [Deltaproteobacteria bacterium]|nr:spore coat protein U domain-containing protein [Deltaproteobacteria bacterium]